MEARAYPHLQGVRGSGKGVGGMAAWGVIGAVLVIVLGLVSVARPFCCWI